MDAQPIVFNSAAEASAAIDNLLYRKGSTRGESDFVRRRNAENGRFALIAAFVPAVIGEGWCSQIMTEELIVDIITRFVQNGENPFPLVDSLKQTPALHLKANFTCFEAVDRLYEQQDWPTIQKLLKNMDEQSVRRSERLFPAERIKPISIEIAQKGNWQRVADMYKALTFRSCDTAGFKGLIEKRVAEETFYGWRINTEALYRLPFHEKSLLKSLRNGVKRAIDKTPNPAVAFFELAADLQAYTFIKKALYPNSEFQSVSKDGTGAEDSDTVVAVLEFNRKSKSLTVHLEGANEKQDVPPTIWRKKDLAPAFKNIQTFLMRVAQNTVGMPKTSSAFKHYALTNTRL